MSKIEWTMPDDSDGTYEEAILGDFILTASSYNEAVIEGTNAYYWRLDRRGGSKVTDGFAGSFAKAKKEVVSYAKKF